MPPIRRRDARAIAFCLTTTAAMFLGAALAFESMPVAILATSGYAAWLSWQPRVQRVMRRLRGDVSWDFSGYYED